MHIVMATTGFYPAVSWGGPVKVVHQNALELQRRGHKVTVVASNLLDKQRRIASGTFQKTVDGLEVHYLHTHIIPQWPGTLGPTWLAPAANRHLWTLIESADVVHVHATRNAISLQAMRHAQKQSKPLVLQPHGTLPHFVNLVGLKQLFDHLFLKHLLRNVDAYIALQATERQQITALISTGTGQAQQIHVIPNGIQADTIRLTDYRGKFRQKYNIPENQRLLLFLGRINYVKGTDLLVKAFAQIPVNLRRNILLVIAGPDDGQLTEVRRLIAHHSLNENVLLTGLLQEDDVWAAHADADLFVLPCRIDAFPMAVVEACKAGTPLVITETCEIAPMLKDKAGAVVPVDTRAIAEAIVKLLEDHTLYQQYRKGTQELVDTTFSMKAIGDALERTYELVWAQKMGADAASLA